jgi:hypothetical protein
MITLLDRWIGIMLLRDSCPMVSLSVIALDQLSLRSVFPGPAITPKWAQGSR